VKGFGSDKGVQVTSRLKADFKMSGLLRIFGSGKKGETQPSPQVAIGKLRDTAEMLEKKTEFIEKKIEVEVATAKKCGMKNKRG